MTATALVKPESQTQGILPGDITAEEAEALHVALAGHHAPATQRAYRSHWSRWESMARSRGWPVLPAEPGHIAVALVSMVQDDLSVASLSGMLSAIADKHADAHLSDPTTDGDLRRVMIGLRRQIGASPSKQAHPLSISELRAMCEALSERGTAKCQRDRALLLLGYAAARRRSELAALQVRDVQRRPDGLHLTIRRSKTDQEAKGWVAGVARGHCCTDPVAAVFTWVDQAHLGALDPLFPRLSRAGRIMCDTNGSTLPISGAAVNDVVRGAVRLAGLDDLVTVVSGHSLRAGGITAAALSGMSNDEISRTTGQASATVSAYTRPVDLISDSISARINL